MLGSDAGMRFAIRGVSRALRPWGEELLGLFLVRKFHLEGNLVEVIKMVLNIREKLAQVPLEGFCKDIMGKPLVELAAATSCEEGFRTLVDNGILSAPLKSEGGVYTGLVDMDDLVVSQCWQ